MKKVTLGALVGLITAGLAFNAGRIQAHGAGSLDTTFGDKGVVIFSAAGATIDALAALEQPSGDIVLVGDFQNNDSTDISLLVARFTSTGKLDTSFGTNGVTTTSLLPFVKPVGAALLANGDVLVAAFTGSDNKDKEIVESALVAYTPNGELDTTFGNGGIVITPVGNENESSVGPLLVQPNGQIVLAGAEPGPSRTSPALTVLLRYNANGSLDTTFGDGGVVQVATSIAPRPGTIALLSNGDYLLLGGNGTEAEFSSTGSPLSTITTAGITALGISADTILQANGNIVAGEAVTAHTGSAGTAEAPGPLSATPESTSIMRAFDAGVARFTKTGLADPTFTNTTFSFASRTSTSTDRSSVEKLAFTGNGQIIVGGQLSGTALDSPALIALARVNANGGLDTTFGHGGVVTTPAGTGVRNLLIQSDGNIVVLAPGAAGDIVVLRILSN